MKASELITMTLRHATEDGTSGEVTDILFDNALARSEFVLADITTSLGTAPVLFGPSVLTPKDGILTITAHPDDISARVDASIHRTEVSVDPTDLPSTFIGPFGNTFSPSMIAALFNARTSDTEPRPVEGSEDGIWFTTLKGKPVRAHVSSVGHVHDVIVDESLTTCEAIEVAIGATEGRMVPPTSIQTGRAPDGALVLNITQGDFPAAR